MLDAKGIVKICDFGISRIEHFNGNSTTTPPHSSVQRDFMPPETRLSRAAPLRPTFATDVFSCGMLIFCLAVGVESVTLQSSMVSALSLVSGIWDGQVTSARVAKPNKWTGVSNEAANHLWTLVQKMTSYDAGDRGSIEEAQQRLEVLENVNIIPTCASE